MVLVVVTVKGGVSSKLVRTETTLWTITFYARARMNKHILRHIAQQESEGEGKKEIVIKVVHRMRD